MKPFILFFFSAFSLQTAFSQSIFYVKTDGNGIGDSWENASNDLTDILSKAQFGDQIWVAAGTYKPTQENDRHATFQIPDGVEIYGGFKGFEKKVTRRHAQENSTVLSGEIGQTTNFDNSFSVVTTKNVSEKTVVDGFVITAGNANINGQNNDKRSAGGGWYNVAENGISNPTIRNTLFIENSATTGGAFFNAGIQGSAAPNFFNCFFIDNEAGFAGGAIYNLSDKKGVSSPKIIMCIIDGNKAEYGGGICNFAKSGESSPIIADSKVRNNSAQYDGGFMKNMKKEGSAAPVVKNTFQINNRDNFSNKDAHFSMGNR